MKKILLAAVLKPVFDVRMYEKIGLSFAEKGFEVGVIGFDSGILQVENVVKILAKFRFERLSLKRLWAGFTFLAAAKRFSPDIILICAVELLPFALFYRFFAPKSKVFYDIQENYYLNLSQQKHYHWFTRHILSKIVGFFEKKMLKKVDGVLLAEKCYLDEIKYLPPKKIVVENKFLPQNPSFLEEYLREKEKMKPSEKFNFLISGTLSQVYGTQEGIAFFLLLKKKYAWVGDLTVFGYAPEKNYRQLLRNFCFENQISHHISAAPLAQNLLLQKAAQTAVWLMPYPTNLSTDKCIPTKFYEALALEKVVLTRKSAFRAQYFAQFPNFIFSDFDENEAIFQDFDKKFPTIKPQTEDAWLWQNEKFISSFLTEFGLFEN